MTWLQRDHAGTKHLLLSLVLVKPLENLLNGISKIGRCGITLRQIVLDATFDELCRLCSFAWVDESLCLQIAGR